jgi:hypothetical protein
LGIFPSKGGADVSFDGSAAAEPPNDHHEGAAIAVAPLRQPGATLISRPQMPTTQIMFVAVVLACVRGFDRL